MKDGGSLAAVLLAVVGLAIIAVLVSRSATTPNVLSGLGASISRIICTAVSPITGSSCGGLTESVHSTVTY